ncbi:MAG: (2Fe-2S) ferredoxin domain-containing protein [Nanoarchaeota archaeon]
MKTQQELGYAVHVLVCCNERASGSCCSAVGGIDIYRALKQWVMERGLARSVWVTRTGCLGFCNDVGVNVVIYPQGLWFLQTTPQNLAHVHDTILRLVA